MFLIYSVNLLLTILQLKRRCYSAFLRVSINPQHSENISAGHVGDLGGLG